LRAGGEGAAFRDDQRDEPEIDEFSVAMRGQRLRIARDADSPYIAMSDVIFFACPPFSGTNHNWGGC